MQYRYLVILGDIGRYKVTYINIFVCRQVAGDRYRDDDAMYFIMWAHPQVVASLHRGWVVIAYVYSHYPAAMHPPIMSLPCSNKKLL